MSLPSEVETVPAEAFSEADRRRHTRHAGRALAEVVRDSDPLRHVLRVELLDVSMSGVGLLIGTKLKNDERIRVRLRNVVQRFLKEVRGIVRWSIPTENGKYRVGIELLVPFTAVDMQMLKRAGIGTNSDKSNLWV
jgi:c-di-GMP-binding flagellar brake protein YcgR